MRRHVVLVGLLCAFAAPDARSQTFVKMTSPLNPIVNDQSTGYDGATWVDYDGDGDLDLFVNQNFHYRNDGGGFTRVATTIGAGERLIIDYRSRLDADSQDAETLTNVAGATEWFNADVANPNRVGFNRTLSDGTPGVPDHEDAHTLTVALFGHFFEKTVENLNSGANPATTAEPGDALRYTLRLQATDVDIADVRIDYSKRTQFTLGTMKTNIRRLDTRNKLRIIGRALWRKLGNR